MANTSDAKKNKLNQELLSAVKAFDEKKVASCLKKGADPDTRNKAGDTLLNIALSNEKISPELIELLVESGAHLNYVSSDRVTPLMCAVYNINVPLETVGYLLQSGASIYSRDTYGQTPLLYATGREDVSLVDLLVTYGASVNETDADGNTLLFEAVRQGYENLFSYLVDQGGDLAVRNYQGTTLLMAAIEQKQEKMANFLLDFSEIDILATRVDGLTALDMIHDMLDDGSLTDDDSKTVWQSLADALTFRVSDRLSFLDELNEVNSDEYFDELDEEDVDTEDFVEVTDGIDDGFDLEQETVLLSEEDEEFSEEEDDVVFELEADEEDDDVVFELEADEEEDDVVFELEVDEEEDDVVFELEADETEGTEEELPYMLGAEDESFEAEEELPYMLGAEDESFEAEEELPYMFGAEDESFEAEEELPYMLGAEDESLDAEEELPYMLGAEDESLDAEEDDIVFELESDEEEDDDIVFELESDEEEDDDIVFELEGDEDFDESMKTDSIAGQEYDPYETKNMDPWTYFETEKSRVVSQVIKVNPAEISSPLEADTVNHLPLYSHEAYQHAEKMIKRYTEYQSEDGQKGVCLSGVYLTNKACSQARVHIERSLLEEGYAPKQAHEQSVVLLYKLIRANGLYHPKEFVLRENGEKSLAFKVWGCDHRLLLKSLINEFAPEGDWYHSLHEIEKYVSEKGEGKLISAM